MSSVDVWPVGAVQEAVASSLLLTLNSRYKFRWRITKFIGFKIKGDRFQWRTLTAFVYG